MSIEEELLALLEHCKQYHHEIELLYQDLLNTRLVHTNKKQQLSKFTIHDSIHPSLGHQHNQFASLLETKSPVKWSKTERARLHAIVLRESQRSLAERVMTEKTSLASDALERGRVYEQTMRNLLTKSEAEIFFTVNSSEISWTRVDFQLNGKFGPFECRRMWTEFLNPTINFTLLNSTERSLLLSLCMPYISDSTPIPWSDLISNHFSSKRPWQLAGELVNAMRPSNSSSGTWTKEMYQQLEKSVNQHVFKFNSSSKVNSLVERPDAWLLVHRDLYPMTAAQCQYRWKHVIGVDRKKGQWSPFEDQLLLAAVKRHTLDGSVTSWISVARLIPSRTDIQCRDRFNRLSNP